MLHTSHIIQRIRDYAADQGWSKTRLAMEAGLSDTTLRHFHSELWNPTVNTLRKLEAAISGIDTDAPH
jgi:ribosome-binding protein aMBF1 (putative translation factor)